jgi:signal transduction histidine kinase
MKQGKSFFHLTHNFIPRLRRLMTAANHWSRGDFSFTIHDEADDEVAALSYDVNSMARQLYVHIAEGQRIAALEERNALARDLHDGAKQLLYALAVQIQIAKELSHQPHSVQTHLQEAVLLLQSLQEEMNNLIHQLRPPVLVEKGLKYAIQDHLQNWSRRNDILTTFISDFQKNEDVLSLQPEQEEALLRVMQEALSNVARHSCAGHVEVHLSSKSQETVLNIIDDGYGFDPERVVPGVGLHSMLERLQACGGTVEISSVPGQGTTVVASLKQNGRTNSLSLIHQPLGLEHAACY